MYNTDLKNMEDNVACMRLCGMYIPSVQILIPWLMMSCDLVGKHAAYIFRVEMCRVRTHCAV
jgi:hypothetical protein